MNGRPAWQNFQPKTKSYENLKRSGDRSDAPFRGRQPCADHREEMTGPRQREKGDRRGRRLREEK